MQKYIWNKVPNPTASVHTTLNEGGVLNIS